jgi:3D (Asp-Asp-Asp) domain-containing protein
LGTKLNVEFPEPFGYMSGTYIAEDTGSAIHGHKVDVYFNSISVAKKFGKKQIKISIVD